MARSVALRVVGEIVRRPDCVREAPRKVFLLREVYPFALPDADCVRAVFFLYRGQFRGNLVHRLLQRYLAEISRAVALERLIKPFGPVEPGDGGTAFYADPSLAANMVWISLYVHDFVVFYVRDYTA